MLNTLVKLYKLKGMGNNTILLLSLLNEKGPLNMYCIHAETGIPQRTLSDVRAQAVWHDYIQKTKCSDRRQCMYELSPKMKELMNDDLDLLTKSEVKEKNFIYGSRGNRVGEFLVLKNGEVYTRKINNKLSGDNSVKPICGKWVKL